MTESSASTKTAPRPRRRMAPEDRRSLILDAAARIVVDEGVSAASMDRVAREAQVSKPLVYNYFDNRANLLSTLLIREYPAFQGTPVKRNADESFEDLIRRTTLDFIDRYLAKGMLIQRLLNEPSVAADVLKKQAKGREATVKFFGDLMEAEFDVAKGTGGTIAELCMGITRSAAQILMRDESDHDRVVDMTVKMIVGAAEKLGSAQ
ncbi:TetR/AcrR family transcriptional regulator [Parasphingopyxis sp.]|uniref:TetR/AcrR family transcriptional regulator n=1 Tax=Parasphingopyxis sp. TaxID=1920299 RepID=UPI002606046F|nr:TetR/AcrR family transcriptional regulator [Parasphingopyxis sp.]